MQPAGLAAHAGAHESRSRIYSYEQRNAAELPPEMARRFRRDKAAWRFFQAQAPWYRRTATWWVVSARKPETQERRLATLIADSSSGGGSAISPAPDPARATFRPGPAS